MTVSCIKRRRRSPTLAGWFAELMEPAVNSFHNQKQRKAVEQNVTRAAETGIAKADAANASRARRAIETRLELYRAGRPYRRP